MNNFARVCDVIKSCKTSAQNNNAYALIFLYEKEMNRVNRLQNSYSLIVWNRNYIKIKRDVEALFDLCDENLKEICK